MIAAEVMTTKPVTVDARASVAAVIHKLRDADVRHLPVLDEGRLVGIVSDRDLRDVMSRLASEGVTEPGRLLNTPIADLMSSNVLSVDAETELPEIIDLMIEHRIGAVPVLSPDTGYVVGIVSYVDLLRAVRDDVA